ncbi:very short patch repair endonuclease [Pseudoduganella lurida]|uniref:very short patch repair endonuclease n=1 Tax=Pseudoduganella lurida TaxID=1036180 RepID=UPI0011A83BF6|nr:very short patch repair endonuclease [Pseudoduganella lurida]
MVDSLTPAQRSERMSRIRGKDSQPELALRRALHRLGLRYRLHSNDLPGKPDMVFPRHKAVVFVHGCFWHRHENCKVATTPKSNTVFWIEKFEKNMQRDRRVTGLLRDLGWRVFVVWECEVNPSKTADTAHRLNLAIRSGELPPLSLPNNEGIPKCMD